MNSNNKEDSQVPKIPPNICPILVCIPITTWTMEQLIQFLTLNPWYNPNPITTEMYAAMVLNGENSSSSSESSPNSQSNEEALEPQVNRAEGAPSNDTRARPRKRCSRKNPNPSKRIRPNPIADVGECSGMYSSNGLNNPSSVPISYDQQQIQPNNLYLAGEVLNMTQSTSGSQEPVQSSQRISNPLEKLHFVVENLPQVNNMMNLFNEPARTRQQNAAALRKMTKNNRSNIAPYNAKEKTKGGNRVKQPKRQSPKPVATATNAGNYQTQTNQLSKYGESLRRESLMVKPPIHTYGRSNIVSPSTDSKFLPKSRPSPVPFQSAGYQDYRNHVKQENDLSSLNTTHESYVNPSTQVSVQNPPVNPFRLPFTGFKRPNPVPIEHPPVNPFRLPFTGFKRPNPVPIEHPPVNPFRLPFTGFKRPNPVPIEQAAYRDYGKHVKQEREEIFCLPDRAEVRTPALQNIAPYQMNQTYNGGINIYAGNFPIPSASATATIVSSQASASATANNVSSLPQATFTQGSVQDPRGFEFKHPGQKSGRNNARSQPAASHYNRRGNRSNQRNTAQESLPVSPNLQPRSNCVCCGNSSEEMLTINYPANPNGLIPNIQQPAMRTDPRMQNPRLGEWTPETTGKK